MTKQDIYDKKVEILKKWEKAIIYERVHNERCIAKKAKQILTELEAVDVPKRTTKTFSTGETIVMLPYGGWE